MLPRLIRRISRNCAKWDCLDFLSVPSFYVGRLLTMPDDRVTFQAETCSDVRVLSALDR
jgi:hypothetical protein